MPSANRRGNKESQILAIDDDPVALHAVKCTLTSAGYEVILANNGLEGIESLTEETSVALVDLKMPGMDGFECLKLIKKRFPYIPVIILTASSEIPIAVKAMKKGAFQFVTKPFDRESLLVHVQKAIKTWQLNHENDGLREALSLPDTTARLIQSPADYCIDVMNSIDRLADLESTVFIGGESGTGKTTAARMIHQKSGRKNCPFVSVNCSSLPRDLIESELFGHAQGAFTGAVKDRIGKAEIADGGTLFLDEIGDLPFDLQPKLLTFLQDRVIQRVGCNVERKLDIRLIVATHRDLKQMGENNRFRMDLYYRLNVLSLQLKPLRKRPEAIESISERTLENLCKREGRAKVSLSTEALDILRSYHWPGNIRELENVLERAVAFSDSDEIGSGRLQFDSPVVRSEEKTAIELKAIEMNPKKELVGLTLEQIEKIAICETLIACDGNKALTARMLGISEKSIYNKLKRLKIDSNSLFNKERDCG